MADSKLSSLTAASALTGTELFYSDDGSADVKVTATQLKTFAVGAGSVSVASTKTLTASNSLTLAGTDSTTMTFPSTSATIARTDAGQTFTGDQTISSGSLSLSGDISANAWTTSGIRYKNVAATLTDTTSTGTVAAAYTNVFGGNTIAASNATTFTDYFTTYISEPTAGTNVTLTNKWAAGFGGNVKVTGALTLGTALSAANGGTGLTALGTGVATALGNATNGSGGLITYSSFAPASGKTLTISNTLTFTGTDSSSVAFGAGGTVLYTTNIASGKSITRFTPLDNQPPASNFATLDTRNSIATLDFDDTTDESAVFVGVITQGATLTSGIKVRIFWAATTATSGDVRWGASFEKYGTDIDSDSFDTVTYAATTTSGTSGIVVVTEITCTSIDSAAAGDQIRLKVTRSASNGADTMTGDAELIAVELQQVA